MNSIDFLNTFIDESLDLLNIQLTQYHILFSQ